MATQSSPFPMRIPSPPPPPSLAIGMKFRTLIFSYLRHFSCAFNKAKSTVSDFLKEAHLNNIKLLESLILKRSKNKNKVYFGSFRLHYNWCSSHVVPVTSPIMQDAFDNHVTDDPTSNSCVDHETVLGSQLMGYLRWLEENNKEGAGDDDEINEIDRLADRFIANCHEKFMLEKQESYRRFQEMMARSI